MKKTLLLSPHFEVMRFIGFRDLIKYLCKGKIEVVSSWNEELYFMGEDIKYPSIVKFTNLTKRNYYNNRNDFSRKTLIKRDKSVCQYCSKKLINKEITIDHLIPKSKGGANNYFNCVVSCMPCNNFKANRTPEEAGMKLIRKPYHPSYFPSKNYIEYQEVWHKDWDNFLNF